MPAIATFDRASVKEAAFIRPRVFIDEKELPHLHCLSVESSAGIQMSRCFLRYMVSADTAGPTTLGRAPVLPYGARVKVVDQLDRLYFLGNLMRRADRGKDDTVLWEAVDDRLFLEHLFVRGCFVGEPTTVGGSTTWKVKFSTRFIARTNPGGMWNCQYVPVIQPSTGLPINLPVFTPYASLCRNYNTPDDDYSGGSTLPAGTVMPWTPRRFLIYLWMVSQVGSGWSNVDGTRDDEGRWRSIYASSRIAWEANDCFGLIGVDPSQGSAITGGGRVGDPLDRKMPDMTFQGMRVLGAIQKTLDCAGTHGLRLSFRETHGAAMSFVDFYNVGFSSVASSQNDQGQTSLSLQRGGPVDDVNTVFDFDQNEDASQVCESVLVEGAPVRVETQLEFLTSGYSSATIRPAWTTGRSDETTNEQAGFLAVIDGNNTTPPAEYAKVPKFPGDATKDGSVFGCSISGWVPADGSLSGGFRRPWAPARSPQAVALARQYFPRVFRAFELVTDNLGTALSGYGGAYANTGRFPQLKHRRLVLPQQLQFMVLSEKNGEVQSNWLLNHIPIRVQVKGVSDAQWVEAQFSTGLRQTADGLLWLDALAETVDSQPHCLYEYSLYERGDGTLPTVKSLRINLALPMDHRLDSYAVQGESMFSEDFKQSLGGPPLAYIDSPDGYHENHQVGSYPMGIQAYYAGSALIQEPLNRILPPGTEANHAYYAARRKLWSSKVPRRSSSWKLIGIRPEWKAGCWVERIKVRGASSDSDVMIRSPIENVTYDFQSQETRVGGLIFQGMI